MESTLKKMYKEVMRDHSSVTPHQQKSTVNEKNELLNILHNQLMTPSTSTDRSPSKSYSHIAIQCSTNDLKQEKNSSDRILIGHLTNQPVTPSSTAVLPGFIECGIQVDLNGNIQSLSQLIEFYSDLVSSEIIKQFYDMCNSDIQLARIYIDDHLQRHLVESTIPTLRQLSLNALNNWNEQLKHSNPSCDTISIGDLLQDINDEEVFDEILLDNTSDNTNSIQFTDPNRIKLPWSYINSLQELYGELPVESSSSNDTDGLYLPLDDDLSMNIYQAIQRFFGMPNKNNKPVNDKKSSRENKKLNKQRWNLPSQNEPNNNSNKNINGPSLKEIMNDELKYMNTQKSVQKRQLDFASQHKLKELERTFPGFSTEVLYEMFCENECDYDLTLACISSMLDENASIQTAAKSQTPSISPKITAQMTTNLESEPTAHSYEVSRRDARLFALKRKDCYNKADQANRHGMTGVASYYINQARDQTRLIKDANRIACDFLSKIRLDQFRRTHRLDLHDLYADEALTVFRQVEQELNEGNKRTTAKSIEVITGYGKNSPYGGGYGKIRSVILAYIKQKKYKYSEPNKGAILVQL